MAVEDAPLPSTPTLQPNAPTPPLPDQPSDPRGLGYWIGFAFGFTARWSLRLLLLFGLSLLAAYFLIQVPAVQRYAARQVSQTLTEQLEAPVRIGRIAIEPFTKLRLENVYFEDCQGDTLVAATALRTSFFQPIRSLLNRSLYVESIALEGARLRLVRNRLQPAGNFQFLLDALSPAQTKPKLTETRPFTVDLKVLTLNDAAVVLEDEYQGRRITGSLRNFEVLLDKFDLPNAEVRGESVKLSDANLVVNLFPQATAGALLPPSPFGKTSPTTGIDTVVNELFGPFAIDLGLLALENVDVELIDGRQGGTPPPDTIGLFNPRHLFLSDLQLLVEGLAVRPDSLGFALNTLSLSERSGFALEALTAEQVSATPLQLTLDGFRVKSERSELRSDASVSLAPGDGFQQLLERSRFRLNLAPSVVSVSELLTFVPALRRIPILSDRPESTIRLRGQLRGSQSLIRGTDLSLRLPGGSDVLLDASVRNPMQPEELLLNLNIERLRTTFPKVRSLVPQARIPKDFDRLGELSFSGRFDGFLNDFVAYGKVQTELGEATLDTRFLAEPGQLARYTGKASLIDFDIGTYTGNAAFGRVTAAANIREGVGLRPGELRLDLLGSVQELVFKDYRYRGIELNGRLAPEGYEGALRFADEHADLDFNGKIRVGDDERLNFTAAVRRLDLAELNLIEEPWSFAGELQVNSNSLDLNNLEGEAQVRGLEVRHADGRSYDVRRITARQDIAPDGDRRLTIDSPFLSLDLSGKYQLRNLPATVLARFSESYPDLYAKAKLPRAALDSNDLRISVDARLQDVDSLINTFRIPVSDLNGTQLTLDLDTERESLDFAVSSSRPKVAGLSFQNLGLDVRGQSGELDVQASSGSLSFGEKFGFQDLQVYSEYADGDLRFSVSADTATSILGDVNLAGAIVLADTSVTFTLDPSSFLDIGGERWTVEAGNELIVGNQRLIANDVALEAGRRSLELETSGLRGLNVLLRNFNLDLFNSYLNPEKVQIAGELDVYISAEDIYAQRNMTVSATVDTLAVNQVDWGAVQALVTVDSARGKLATYTTFSRLGQTAILDAVLALEAGTVISGTPRERNYFDAVVTTEAFDMSFLSYFIPGITDLRGKLGADLHVFGTPDAPIPEGGILVDECALTVDYLKTRYYVDDQYVSIDQRILDASGRQIRDGFGNVATLTGGLLHEDLKKWWLNLEIRTNRLNVLATERLDNPLYYGTAFADGRISFNGPFNQTDLDIDAKALSGSKVVFPVSGTSTNDGLRFIDFRKPEDSTRQQTATFLRGINLDMDIEITPTAELLIVFDESAGDILRGQGTGNIQIDVQRSGSYSMFGNYAIEEGDYLFTLLNVVNKPFTILPGGNITWDGDPFSAQLNITAAYQGLSVAPIGLIPEYEAVLQGRSGGSQGQSDGLLNLAYQPTNVELNLDLTGDLQRPDLAFEINLPELQGELRNYVTSKLTLIRQDVDELNRQVFGLIVIGQFLPSFTDIQASTVGFNTISELFSNQLSYVLTELFTSLAGSQGALSGIDIDINLQNSSSLGNADIRTGNDVQTKLRTYFFDDRLVIDVGANFGRVNAVSGGNNSGQLTAGKFEVSYALTDDRRLRLKTFASTSVDIGSRNLTRAGVGLSWRRQFDSFGEVFSAAKAEEKRQQTPSFFKDATPN